jgi:N-acetylglutamate synthase-like GNAT family acetyltransferase
MNPEILITRFKDLKLPIEEFYHSCERETQLEPEDTLVIAQLKERIVGVVRLCFEDEAFVLRTMQVHPDFQRRGVGQIILKAFEVLLDEKEVQEIFCMPYEHLEEFYGQIGFKRILENEAPLFLQKRLENFVLKYPSEKAILMRRLQID